MDAVLTKYNPIPNADVPEAPNEIQRSLEQQITTFQLMNPRNATFEQRLLAVQAAKIPGISIFNNRLSFSSAPSGENGTLETNDTKISTGDSVSGVEAAISLQLNASSDFLTLPGMRFFVVVVVVVLLLLFFVCLFVCLCYSVYVRI